VWDASPVDTTIAPWLPVPDGAAAVAFYEAAFGATMLDRLDDGAGGVAIAELDVGGARFWVQQGDEPDRARLILTVADPDAAFARAITAGGTEVAAVHEAHGWRVGRLADPAGHHWELGRRLTG
jgi:PhnB protein